MITHKGTFIGTLIFGAIAALAFAPVTKLASTWMSATTAAALYLTAGTAVYVGMVGTGRSLRLAAVVLASSFGITSTLLASNLTPTVLALTLALACSRARILYRGRLEHAWVAELVLALIALIAVQAVVSPTYRGIALATWVYWLVQSAYFLVPTRAGEDGHAAKDPFDAAVNRATELMDDAP